MGILHPFRVAFQFRPFSRRFWIGLLHDTIEDGWMSYTALRHFNHEIAISVDHLTRDADETYAEYIDRLVTLGSPEEIDVKRADLLDNYRRCRPSLRKRYAKALMKLDGGR